MTADGGSQPYLGLQQTIPAALTGAMQKKNERPTRSRGLTTRTINLMAVFSILPEKNPIKKAGLPGQ
jgi:hypothetical protein